MLARLEPAGEPPTLPAGSASEPLAVDVADSPAALVSGTPTPEGGGEGNGLPCGLIAGTYDPWPQTIALMSETSAAVLVGRFASYGEAYWNTPDRKPPDLATLREGRAEIRTPVQLEAVEALRGDMQAADHAVLWNQGKVGCLEMTLDTSPDLRLGESYALFLKESRSTKLEADADLSVMAAWPVDEKGDVATAENGILSVTQLDSALDAGISVDKPDAEEPNTEPDPDSGWP
jgi:hypothetical protein